MAKLPSRFFQTKSRKGDTFFAPGIKLVHRGEVVGSICPIKSTKMFDVAVVNRANKLFQAEFANFTDADQFAWLKVTS